MSIPKRKLNKSYLSLWCIALFFSCQDQDNTLQEKNLKIESMLEFTDENGNKISHEELTKSTGTYNYEIIGDEHVSAEARTLKNEASAFGQMGSYRAAVEKFNAAHQAAPTWPYPTYDLAYTYLLQGDHENALKYYRITDSLAPRGFFTSKTALHTLEREKSGDLLEGIYLAYLSLEWIEDTAKKQAIAKSFVVEFPNFAPGWKEYSTFFEGQERLDAIESGLSANPDIETHGILSINKAIILDDRDDYQAAEKLLLSVIFDSSATLGNVELAKFVLADMLERKD